MRSKAIEVLVGAFMIAGLLGLMILAFKVSGLTSLSNGGYYTLTAEFNNIGSLKVRAPISVAGVKVGQVEAITLDPKTFKAKVTLLISKDTPKLPMDTTASILTQGILGSNYISLMPGFDTKVIQPKGAIETTHSALILENLVGQLMYSLKNDKK